MQEDHDIEFYLGDIRCCLSFFLNSVLNLSFGLSPYCVYSHISPTVVSDVWELELGGRRRDQDTQ